MPLLANYSLVKVAKLPPCRHCLASLHVDAGIFRFTKPVYDRDEGTGQAVVIVEMPSDSGVLVNPVPITVQTVNTGSATGE